LRAGWRLPVRASLLAGDGRLDLKVTDLGPQSLKNIAELVHVYSLEVGHAAQAKRRSRAFKRRLAPLPLAAAIAALLLLAAAGGWYMLGRRLTKPAEAAHLLIVVVPFANLSGDPAQDYLADALTDELTTALARIRDSFVIARNTAFTFKGKPVDAKAIGKVWACQHARITDGLRKAGLPEE
jgi:hypothetical protein